MRLFVPLRVNILVSASWSPPEEEYQPVTATECHFPFLWLPVCKNNSRHVWSKNNHKFNMCNASCDRPPDQLTSRTDCESPLPHKRTHTNCHRCNKLVINLWSGASRDLNLQVIWRQEKIFGDTLGEFEKSKDIWTDPQEGRDEEMQEGREGRTDAAGRRTQSEKKKKNYSTFCFGWRNDANYFHFQGLKAAESIKDCLTHGWLSFLREMTNKSVNVTLSQGTPDQWSTWVSDMENQKVKRRNLLTKWRSFSARILEDDRRRATND